MMGFSSVSWSKDHIRDALVDNDDDWSKSTQARSQESQSQEGRVVFVSRAGYPLSSPRGRVIYGGKRWVFIPEVEMCKNGR